MTRLIVALVLLLAPFAYGQSFKKIVDPTLCKNKIDTHIKRTTSIIANFKEENYSSMFNSVKTAQGNLKYKKTDKIRWEHTAPKKQLILIDGKNMRIKENGKEVNSVTAKRVVRNIQSLMLQLFNGKFLHEKEFRITFYENIEYYKLLLKPKNSTLAKYISQIELVFDKKLLYMHQLTLKETEEDKIVYTFSSVSLNQFVSNSNFTQF